ncbi:hypothetical protein Q2T42_10615 [Leptolyngbya boryana CZ1]|jgi:hypothetical protein|uniref:Uncharacterized protein n=2 Tax=Leptolyngbya boryana TaxID=1184 RepID=A0A1Z4JQD9_LEPBY|nr:MULTISPECIES: hypothetical protein [Leptolyngbya]BAY58946.1 hypothetical protein NIES2135_58210 [Leptolyngbya boryana NIES-2135]MBD2368302.1 hypothetical protein [Leptolyngbya sp. FACHB-161]MBD2374658.1 hypothetical protein [Leptolyngbya sp. FACHB-238]MBD2399080.1 hypothetical protein [Leptolyngbya sp. FACHB-239]MBD2405086.1 hypothetical protein [Leptolyngbya sp. FACHB-402]
MTNNATALLKVLKIEFREFCVDFLSLGQIKGIFSNAGFTLENEASSGGARRGLVDEFYAATDWQKIENIHKFFKVIEYILQLHYISDEAKDRLRSICTSNGFGVEDNKINYEGSILGEDLFAYQFPAGLPFGVLKPDFSISAEKGGQTLKYELQDGLGLVRGKVYPDFSFKMLEASYGLDASKNRVLKKAMIDMNQSEYEKKFFIEYAKRFDMANQDLPVLIPQAWIQWHSQAKKNLRSASSLHMDDLYRVDFVAFWNNRRYVILVDDISHYATKKESDWYADQEAYSKRLKEDRKLRKENWHVFRVSNWELRDGEKLQSTLSDLREFITF